MEGMNDEQLREVLQRLLGGDRPDDGIGNEFVMNPDAGEEGMLQEDDSEEEEDEMNESPENSPSFFETINELPEIDISEIISWFLAPLPYLCMFAVVFLLEHFLGSFGLV